MSEKEKLDLFQTTTAWSFHFLEALDEKLSKLETTTVNLDEKVLKENQ